MRVRPCVTIIIVTYQSAGQVGACLKSLRANASDWIAEIRVVDNASTDESAKVVRQCCPETVVIENSENVGFSRGVNIGAKNAETEFLLVLNPDTAIAENALGEMVHFLDHRQEAAACGPKMLDSSGGFQPVCRRSFPTPWNSLGYYTGMTRLFPKSRRWSSYKPRSISPDSEMLAEVISGACILIRTEDFRTIDGFDEDYFLFGEDIDLCWKLHHNDRELWYIPSAEVMHVKGASMEFARSRAKREFYRSMLIYIDKRLSDCYSIPARMLMKSGVRFRHFISFLPGL